MKCIISCEHASNRVPSRFAHILGEEREILTTHRAYDVGAGDLARLLGERCGGAVHYGAISRLLIDLNRSPSNRRSLFGPCSKKLARQERLLLLQDYYLPYREKVESAVQRAVFMGSPVLHLSVHSFTPVRSNTVRKADIGLLYDPGRKNEKLLCSFLSAFLREKADRTLVVRRNYPYRGNTDGFITFLRRRMPARLYAGVEIEMNQVLPQIDEKYRTAVNVLTEGIGRILQCEDFADVMAIDG